MTQPLSTVAESPRFTVVDPGSVPAENDPARGLTAGAQGGLTFSARLRWERAYHAACCDRLVPKAEIVVIPRNAGNTLRNGNGPTARLHRTLDHLRRGLVAPIAKHGGWACAPRDAQRIVREVRA